MSLQALRSDYKLRNYKRQNRRQHLKADNSDRFRTPHKNNLGLLDFLTKQKFDIFGCYQKLCKNKLEC